MTMRVDLMIDPVTRIEGHAKITLQLGDGGSVEDARFHVTEFRGFEEFCRGRMVSEMPSLTARTCGICPASHLLASAKAGDALMGVIPPDTAVKLRTLVNLGQITQSHALSFFHLSAPDLLLGFEADPATRNVFGLMAEHPDPARRGIRLRSFGQGILETIAGRKVHSPGIVPGGVANPLSEERRDQIRADLPEALQTALDSLELYRSVMEGFQREIDSFGQFPSLFLGMANDEGTWEHHVGHLKVIDAEGNVVADRIQPDQYRDYFGEATNRDSYLKSPYYKPHVEEGAPVTDGLYRVGPLARVNMAERMGTPLADEALTSFRERVGGIALSSFHYHEARLIEIICCLERMGPLLDDPMITDHYVRATGNMNRRRAVGVSEAPRGTLFHEYEVNEHGVVQDVNLIIATGQNNLGMNATVLEIAKEFVDGPDIPEPTLNRIEAGIRAYDPCLSCSTHAIGQMPMVVTVEDNAGNVLSETRRD
jgi:NAD-reducing hydrogenase large subunit